MRLSKLIAQNCGISRREAERQIRNGDVTIAGQCVREPHYLVTLGNPLLENGETASKTSSQLAIKVQGQLLDFKKSPKESDVLSSTRVWIAHKLVGEMVSDSDPLNRPCLIQRLERGGLGRRKGRQKVHLKSIGRLDMSTQGLILITNDGEYARAMELPKNQIHRTYRVRVHGLVTQHKLKSLQKGIRVPAKGGFSPAIQYGPMLVKKEETRKSPSSTNQWLTVTCSEGKNRQIRKALEQLGCTFHG